MTDALHREIVSSLNSQLAHRQQEILNLEMEKAVLTRAGNILAANTSRAIHGHDERTDAIFQRALAQARTEYAAAHPTVTSTEASS